MIADFNENPVLMKYGLGGRTVPKNKHQPEWNRLCFSVTNGIFNPELGYISLPLILKAKLGERYSYGAIFYICIDFIWTYRIYWTIIPQNKSIIFKKLG